MLTSQKNGNHILKFLYYITSQGFVVEIPIELIDPDE